MKKYVYNVTEIKYQRMFAPILSTIERKNILHIIKRKKKTRKVFQEITLVLQ